VSGLLLELWDVDGADEGEARHPENAETRIDLDEFRVYYQLAFFEYVLFAATEEVKRLRGEGLRRVAAANKSAIERSASGGNTAQAQRPAAASSTASNGTGARSKTDTAASSLKPAPLAINKKLPQPQKRNGMPSEKTLTPVPSRRKKPLDSFKEKKEKVSGRRSKLGQQSLDRAKVPTKKQADAEQSNNAHSGAEDAEAKADDDRETQEANGRAEPAIGKRTKSGILRAQTNAEI
jgi:hypothetical protein